MWRAPGNSPAIALSPSTPPTSGRCSRVRSPRCCAPQMPRQFGGVDCFADALVQRVSIKERRQPMTISPLAGKPAPKDILVDLARLEREYYTRRPDMEDPTQRVSFGTSGHRGSPLQGSFTEAHILAITQAICDYRRSQGTDGPLYMGKDMHFFFGPAAST